MLNRILQIIAGLILSISCNTLLEEELPIIKDSPSFKLIDQNNFIYTDQEFLGKITVLDFMFTTCMGPCPIMSNNMRSLYEEYRENKRVQFVSITVDPQNDSQETLKDYSENQGVDDFRWKFLTGDINNIKSISEDGFLLFADNLPVGHSIKFILIDSKKRIRKYYNGMDLNEIQILKKDIKKLLVSK
tara:strand:+ start:364 stop:927 length:564 start_codon:yes stop_codon:yes gene_type:complete